MLLPAAHLVDFVVAVESASRPAAAWIVSDRQSNFSGDELNEAADPFAV